MTVVLFVSGELTEFCLCLDFVYDGTHKAEGTAVLCIGCRCDEVHAALPQELTGGVFLAWTGGVKNRNSVASGKAHKLHGGDVGLSVSEVDHVVHGDAFVGIGPTFIDKL